MRPYWTLLCAAAFTLTATGCPSVPADTDNLASSPDLPRIPADIEVEDSLNAGGGDALDWKEITALDDGEASLKVIVGDPFGGAHGITGSISVFPKSGPPAIANSAITPSEHGYTLEWEAEADETYLVKIEATKGKAPYKIAFEVEAAPTDPCADVECDEGQECQEGACVAVVDPNVCEPACRRGRSCVEGECVRPCGGKCPTGKLCSRSKNICIKDPCYRKNCGSGKYCQYGVCKTKASSRPPAGCSPKCGANEECKGTTCVEKVEKLGPVSGKIIQLIPLNKKTALVLNRGSKAGVQKGATGRINGVSGTFKVTEVYPFRSKATIAVDEKTIGSARTVSINR